MSQKIELLDRAEIQNCEMQRSWVRNHYEPGSQKLYETVEGKLELLEFVLVHGCVETHETWKLQSLGITLGDALAQQLGLTWVAVEDEYGRDPALEDPESTIKLFPLTMISKRVEQGEIVDVRVLFDGICERVAELRAEISANAP